MSATVREAAAEDDETVADVIARAFRTVAERFGLDESNCPKHPSNCRPAWVERHRARGGRYFLLEEGGCPLGCVAIEEAKGRDGVSYLERLAVVPGSRGQGFGRLLVDHAHREAKKRGARRIEIAIVAEQHELRAWYETCGYAATETRRFDHLPFLVLFMARAL